MIKANWNVFKLKFAENPQQNFEWFCYLLFCNEFNRPHGIFRYANQAAIETDPIYVGDQNIGWQAKFYETPLSAHKDDLLKAINNAKKYYPNISKLIVYSNQEWGQNKGKVPAGLKEIEDKAAELNINLEWRTSSYFETEFVCVKNESISKHFFTLDKSIFYLISEQQKHTSNILFQVQSSINFNGQIIEIDRNEYLDTLIKQANQVAILSGTGGVGKTAVIKKLYEQFKDNSPFYVFKANQFELTNLNELFKDFNVYDFFEAHQNDSNKIVVIDSAEKLLDLHNTDPFKEFLSELIKNHWKVIFTTRHSYLDDLNYQFLEVYRIAPHYLNINNLNQDELIAITDKYSFSLPKDEKLVELIKNPFYLEEYLSFYKDDEELNYSEFKNKLWDKSIKRSKPERERCFLAVALERADKGQFYVNPAFSSEVLDRFVEDGILGYELPGYFITHDIYEEWAIERYIQGAFVNRSNNQSFFESIGHSLPVRRCFRNWLSEKLLLQEADVKEFIQEAVQSEVIEVFWKDEIFVSVLLSNYSRIFFTNFRKELVSNDLELLKKLTFILRIACKEVDGDFFKLIGIKNQNLFTFKYVFTKPKGQGWNELIKFVFENLNSIGIENINFVLPVIHDWNSKFKTGETTKLSSRIALKYYEWAIVEDVYFSRDDFGKKLMQSIVYGSSEIKEELSTIFDKIIENEWKNHRSPYHDISKFILTELEGFTVCSVLPVKVLRLADLFWTYTPQENDFYSSGRIDLEEHFNIEKDYLEYHPSSSYQTPIYTLLNSSLNETIDFIIRFTNKAVTKFAHSRIGISETDEIDVVINENKHIKQFISNRIWCIYRGTQVAPHLLESMHMALEKFFIENGKHTDAKILEGWLLYLLENTQSASISAIVTSIVLAYPDKTFNIAKILFQNKDFFLYDTNRYVLDRNQKSQLQILKRSFSLHSKNELHENERLVACDDKHRKWSLESLCLNYQCFRSEAVSEDESTNRQNEIWRILDAYYSELPMESEQSDADKTWRLFLARMDKRKMNITTEETDGGIAIQFNPELESDLIEYSERSQEESLKHMRHMSLRQWAEYKFSNNEQYKKYQYTENYKLALDEAKDIYTKLSEPLVDDNFVLFNHSIPVSVSCVLLRDYLNELSEEERIFCKDLVLAVSTSSLNSNYRYQIDDGVQESFSVLPLILDNFPHEKDDIKFILLMGLFNESHVGGMLSNQKFTVFSILAVHELWATDFEDAQSLLLGYLLVKPRYDHFMEMASQENYKKGIYEFDWNQFKERFLEENKGLFEKIIENKVVLSDIESFEDIDLNTLNVAFRLILPNSANKNQKNIVKNIISNFAKKLRDESRDEKIEFSVKHDFLEKYAYFVLSSPKDEIEDLLTPFIENFKASKYISELIQEFVIAEDRLNTKDNFWFVWDLLKENIFKLCERGERYGYVADIIQSYLFARCPWKETTKEWHSLQDSNKSFFQEVSLKIGHCASTLYSISKLLNDIGSNYLDDGVIWIFNILDKNKIFENDRLRDNTIYYIENLTRKYIFINREKIKKTKPLKDKILVILDFLVVEGSVVGYMLRESIL